MIYLELGGRLGNQFFRYAYAKLMQILRARNEQIVFCVSRYNNNNGVVDYKNGLVDFNIGPILQIEEAITQRYPFYLFQIMRMLYLIKRVFHIENASFEKYTYYFFSKMGLISACYGNYKIIVPDTKDVFIDGNFQDYGFCDKIKQVVLDEFVPRKDMLTMNKEIYSAINTQESVCVHIRRGDYLSERYRADFYVCDRDYYLKALDEIKKKVKNPVFIFFSDDIEWVKENIKIEGDCYYEPCGNPLWESFRMMYSCKHFVISNSTLSWWAQYLSRNDKKIVISPDHWFNNRCMDERVNLIMPDFTKIDCDYNRL